MPLSAHPTPESPWNRGPHRAESADAFRVPCRRRARGHGHPLLIVLGALVLLVAAAAGVGLFFVSNGLPPIPVRGGAPSAPLGSLSEQPHGRLATAPVASDLTAGSVCVSGNRDTFGSSVTVGPGEWVCGNVSVYGGSVAILGRVTGNVTVLGGSATVSGRVDGNLTAIGGGVDLRDGATVGGNVDAVGGSIRRGAGVSIGGNVEQGFESRGGTSAPWLRLFDGSAFPWFHILFWALAGLLVAAIFPVPLRRVREVARREPVLSFASGLAALFFGIVAALVLFITCLGIPIALLLVLSLWLAWIVGTAALGYWIGEGLLRVGAAHDRSPVVATVLGVTLLSLAESIPCLGGVISFVAGFTGLGAAALALLYSRRFAGRRSRL